VVAGMISEEMREEPAKNNFDINYYEIINLKI